MFNYFYNPKQQIYLKQLIGWSHKDCQLSAKLSWRQTAATSGCWCRNFPPWFWTTLHQHTHTHTQAENMLIFSEPCLMQTPQTSRHTLPVLLSLYRHDDLQAFYYPTRNRKSGKFPNVTYTAGRWSHLDLNVLANHLENFHVQVVWFDSKTQMC